MRVDWAGWSFQIIQLTGYSMKFSRVIKVIMAFNWNSLCINEELHSYKAFHMHSLRIVLESYAFIYQSREYYYICFVSVIRKLPLLLLSYSSAFTINTKKYQPAPHCFMHSQLTSRQSILAQGELKLYWNLDSSNYDPCSAILEKLCTKSLFLQYFVSMFDLKMKKLQRTKFSTTLVITIDSVVFKSYELDQSFRVNKR